MVIAKYIYYSNTKSPYIYVRISKDGLNFQRVWSAVRKEKIRSIIKEAEEYRNNCLREILKKNLIETTKIIHKKIEEKTWKRLLIQ